MTSRAREAPYNTLVEVPVIACVFLAYPADKVDTTKPGESARPLGGPFAPAFDPIKSLHATLKMTNFRSSTDENS